MIEGVDETDGLGVCMNLEMECPTINQQDSTQNGEAKRGEATWLQPEKCVERRASIKSRNLEG